MSLESNSATINQLYLISMGIGDPDNITLRALKTVEKANIILPRLNYKNLLPYLRIKNCIIPGTAYLPLSHVVEQVKMRL
ncbi:hypothetical protein OURE66S_04539 [Oligella ureolytica]